MSANNDEASSSYESRMSVFVADRRTAEALGLEIRRLAQSLGLDVGQIKVERVDETTHTVEQAEEFGYPGR